MLIAPNLAKLDQYLRPVCAACLPPWLVTKVYSSGRKLFLNQLAAEQPPAYTPPADLAVTCWGLKFQTPIFNGAGMFKHGDGYACMAAQGAGAFLAGTISLQPRPGNRKAGITHPFTPYPASRAASNWMGLPNPGVDVLLRRLEDITAIPGCPVGVSVGPSANLKKCEELSDLLECLRRLEQSRVDFIEFNISCPNTASRLDEFSELGDYLKGIADGFLSKRKRQLPVIVKVSNDISLQQLQIILLLLIDLRFDGINIGNTSTRYQALEGSIEESEKKLYRYFTGNFGGGVSGAPLAEASLAWTRAAAEIVKNRAPRHEFHIISTGGIFDYDDLQERLNAGASLTQWFTGYFEGFARFGHGVYRELFNSDRSTQKPQD